MGRPFGDRGLRDSCRTTRGEAQEPEGGNRSQSGPDGAATSDQPVDTEPAGGRQPEHHAPHARSSMPDTEMPAGRPLRVGPRAAAFSASVTPIRLVMRETCCTCSLGEIPPRTIVIT